MNLRDKIKVVIAEDEPVLRAGLCAKIPEIDPDFLVAAEAEDGRAALERIRDLRPQVVLTDIKMPVMDGMELIRQICLCHPTVKIVILSGYSDFTYTQQAIRYGVFNYLLKPIDDEALRDVLAELKSEIIATQYHQNRTVIYSANYHSQEERTGSFALFSICLGSLCGDPSDAYLREIYAQQRNLDWHKLLTALLPERMEWFLSEEEEKNQRMLCVHLRPGERLDCEILSQRLQNMLQALLGGTPVNLCTSLQTFVKEDVWICSQRMWNILRQKIVPARGQCFLLERDETGGDETPLGIVRLRINDQLRAAIEAKDVERIQQELEMIVRFMVGNAVPQQDMQKVILFILRVLEFSGDVNEAQCQTKILRYLSTAADPERFADELVRLLMRCIAPEQNPEESASLTQQLVEYVDRHYLQLDNMEDVTQVFRYNYAYLSRLFKKEKGMPMSRYVLEKRIELAKRVIENNDALNVMQIAEMSGFGDKRYFHRAFKSCTGMTPQAYKKSVIVKG